MFRSVNTKIVVAFIVVLTATSSIALALNYAFIREHEHELFDSMGLAAAQECAAMLEIAYDDGSGGEFVPGTRDYDTCLTLLRTVCKASGMNYMYAYRVDIENHSITYIMAVGASDEENEVISRERPYGTVVDTEISDIEMRALSDEEVRDPIETNNQFGSMCDWFSLADGLGNDILAGASYSVEAQRKRVLTTTFNAMMPFMLAFLVLLVIEVIILQRSVFRPLRTISGRMRAFSAENEGAFEPLGIVSKDEIGDIAEAFEGMAGDIKEYVSSIERMATERAQANYELDVSRRIQQGMVPERTEKAGAGFSACGFSRPARKVGGDFYDVIELADGRIAVAVGDASGKGMSAALFMTVAKTIIRDGLLAGENPAKVLGHANARIASQNPEGMFITVFACVLDPKTAEVRYANAGHMPPLIIGNDVRVLEVEPGELIGVFDDAAIEEGALVLEPGQGLLIYTDGVVEAKAADGSFVGERRFLGAMGARAPYAGAGEMVDAVVHLVDEFVEGCEQFDDLTVAALAYDGVQEDSPSGVSELPGFVVLPCDMASFSKVRDVLLSADADDALKRKACLACEEAFVNIASYSGATQIWAKVSERDGQLRIELADDGVPFDPLSAEPSEKDFEDLDSGGMGINIVRELASGLEYRHEAGRNILTIVVS